MLRRLAPRRFEVMSVTARAVSAAASVGVSWGSRPGLECVQRSCAPIRRPLRAAHPLRMLSTLEKAIAVLGGSVEG
jgi:hypothetical protein